MPGAKKLRKSFGWAQDSRHKAPGAGPKTQDSRPQPQDQFSLQPSAFSLQPIHCFPYAAAFATLEFAFLVAIVCAVLMVVHPIINSALQGAMKASADTASLHPFSAAWSNERRTVTSHGRTQKTISPTGEQVSTLPELAKEQSFRVDDFSGKRFSERDLWEQ